MKRASLLAVLVCACSAPVMVRATDGSSDSQPDSVLVAETGVDAFAEIDASDPTDVSGGSDAPTKMGGDAIDAQSDGFVDSQIVDASNPCANLPTARQIAIRAEYEHVEGRWFTFDGRSSFAWLPTAQLSLTRGDGVTSQPWDVPLRGIKPFRFFPDGTLAMASVVFVSPTGVQTARPFEHRFAVTTMAIAFGSLWIAAGADGGIYRMDSHVDVPEQRAALLLGGSVDQIAWGPRGEALYVIFHSTESATAGQSTLLRFPATRSATGIVTLGRWSTVAMLGTVDTHALAVDQCSNAYVAVGDRLVRFDYGGGSGTLVSGYPIDAMEIAHSLGFDPTKLYFLSGGTLYSATIGVRVAEVP